MNYKKITILSWNCRGLGILEKCNVVREIIRSSRCDVCMLQETKINEFSLNYMLPFLPSYFNQKCVFNVADRSKGGILIAWKNNYELLNSWSTPHTVTVTLFNISSGSTTTYTVAYGPSSSDELRGRFIEELNELPKLIQTPWILVGDFNLVRWLIDRTGDLRCSPLMDLFNDFIQ